MSKGGKRKRTLKQKLVRLAIFAVLLIVVVIAGIAYFLDNIAAEAIRVAGSDTLGVTVEIDSVDLKPFSGFVGLSRLTIGNPEGFETPHFISLRSGELDVNEGSITSDLVEADHLHLRGLSVNLEKSDRGENYQVILDNIAKGEKGVEEPDDDTPAKKFIIREVKLTDIDVRADISLTGLATRTYNVHLDEIELHDVGSDTGGAALNQVIGKLIKAILAGILQAGGLPDAISDGLGEGLKGVKGVGEFTITSGGKVINVTGDGIKGVAKGIRGLLGRD